MDTTDRTGLRTAPPHPGSAPGDDPDPARPSRIHRVAISTLKPADSPRGPELDAGHLQALLTAEGPLPPITVHRATRRVVDGSHRLRAAVLRGETSVDVRYVDGTAADAFVLAVRCNARHGLPLTTAQRTAAAERILLTHPQLSDRALAAVTGLAAATIGALRRRGTTPVPVVPARLGRDGRLRPTDGSDGRLAAGRLLAQYPGASLREIARRAGVSATTAGDVRRRLLRGEDPVPGPRTAPAGERARTRNPAGRSDRRLDVIFHSLCRDPSLRHTETGRLLLRLFEIHACAVVEWEHVASCVPPHCADTVLAGALKCAETWQDFARRLAAGGPP